MPLQFQKAKRDDPVTAFWQWFLTNEAQIYNVEANLEAVLDAVENNLKRIDEDLEFAIGSKDVNGKREFILSGGGLPSAFPAVEKLASKAPLLPRWRIQKYRPRLNRIPDAVFNELRLSVSQVKYVMMPEGKKIGLSLFIEGYSDANRELYGGAAFLMLDSALGEYEVATLVGNIEIGAPSPETRDQCRPIAELPAEADAYFRK